MITFISGGNTRINLVPHNQYLYFLRWFKLTIALVKSDIVASYCKDKDIFCHQESFVDSVKE